MIYSGKVLHSGNTMSVCLVGGGDKSEAMKKILTLYEPYQIDSVEIVEIEDSMIGKSVPSRLENFYVGGMILASGVDYGD